MDNLVKRAKSKLNLSREQIADAVGVHPSTVWRWENCAHVPGPAKRLLEDMLSAKRAAQ